MADDNDLKGTDWVHEAGLALTNAGEVLLHGEGRIEDRVAEALVHLGSVQVLLSITYPHQYAEASHAVADLVSEIGSALGDDVVTCSKCGQTTKGPIVDLDGGRYCGICGIDSSIEGAKLRQVDDRPQCDCCGATIPENGLIVNFGDGRRYCYSCGRKCPTNVLDPDCVACSQYGNDCDGDDPDCEGADHGED